MPQSPHIFKKNDDKSLHDLGGSGPVLTVTIGWENKPKPGLINKFLNKREDADLDLSCVIYDIHGERQDCVWYAQLRSKDGAVRHSGDNTVGLDDCDDEAITIDLNQISPEAKSLFFVISSFKHDGFAAIKYLHWRVMDAAAHREMGRYVVTEFPKISDPENAKILLRLQKETLDGITMWRVKALDTAATGQNVQEVFSEIRSLLDAA